MKFLLDANSLLNATFIAKSWSAMATQKAIQNGDDLFISNEIRGEAIRTIARHSTGILPRFDPIAALDRAVAELGIGVVYCGSQSKLANVSDHDQHVELAARLLNATVLTNDIRLSVELKSFNVPVKYPLELFSEYAPGSMSTLFFGVRPTSDYGSFFFRGRPHGGVGTTEEVLELIRWPSFSLRYEFIPAVWKLYCFDNCILEAAFELERFRQLELALSWTEDRVVLRVGDRTDPEIRPLTEPIGIDFRQQGSLVPGYMGSVFLATMDNRPLSKRLWKKALSDPPYASPNPYDVDRARTAIREYCVFGTN